MSKDLPAGAFNSTSSHAVPDGDADSLVPQAAAESATPAAGAAKHPQFSTGWSPNCCDR